MAQPTETIQPGIAAAEEGLAPVEQDQSNVDPKEQAIYEKFMENYMRVMYDTGTKKGPKGEPALVDDVKAMLKDVQDPVYALGAAAETVVGFLADSAEKAGKPIPPDVLMHVSGNEVIPDLAELSEKSGYHEYTPEEMSGALQVGMSLYIEERKDKIDVNAFKADMQLLQQAEQSGTIDDLVPGITDLASQAPEQPMPQQQPAGQPPPMGGAGPMPGIGAAQMKGRRV